MKKIIPVFIAVVLILLIGGFYMGQRTLDRYSYSRERADVNEYFGITDPDETAVLLNDERIDIKAAVLDGGCYLSLSDVDALLNGRFYHCKADGTLVYTTPSAIITATVGEKTWSSTDGSNGSLDYAIARPGDDDLWVLVDYVTMYTALTWEYFEDPSRIRLVNDWPDFDQATVTKDTELRVLGGVKSAILRDLEKGERVTVLEQMENWSEVRTADAYIGYVENKRLSDPIRVEALKPQNKTEEYTSIHKPYMIDMVWHFVAGKAGNDTLQPLLSSTDAGSGQGLNTIAPTWFTLCDGEGNITSFATSEYVQQAHAKGLEVWGVVDNFNNPDADAESALARASTRKRIIDSLMSEVAAVGLDGINVDFELIPSSSGEDYIEFIRELGIACRKNSLVLSVDNYVPMGSLNDHYDRAEQGVVADYVIIMGYDEHYAGSSEAGSVASIGYVENGIKRTVAEVPPEKVIGGIPFYTRVWATKDGEVSSNALSMPLAQEWVEQRGITLAWDDETCQNYGELTESDGTLRQVWIEDAESIRTKISVMRNYGIAGVAAWQLGQESPDIWETIANALAN